MTTAPVPPHPAPAPDAALPGLAAELRAVAETAGAWPFEEARKIVERLKRSPKDEVLFETGYGPSGLPHIGTFGEVARTTMVRHAFRTLTEDKVKTRLVAFSDDMDGLRKVPDNVPNKEMLKAALGLPLTNVPDPFGLYDSFGAHNNARLRSFLDAFGFEYEFMSASRCYLSGTFDATLLKVLANYEKILEIMLPSLREERAASYSPFLPVCPRSGRVLQVPILSHDVAAGTVTYADPETQEHISVPVTGGHCKLQWKPDWAMRWVAMGVDYEMAGKDLIDSVKLSAQIARALGAEPPEGFNYELFLDEKGQKISKSKGNGLSIEDWLTYASPESLALFMYQSPRSGKRLFFDVIPRNVDDYFGFLAKYPEQDLKLQLGNPVWHIHSGHPPQVEMPISFTMLLNLAAASNTEDESVLWGFLRRHVPGVSAETHPKLAELVGYAVKYFQDFVKPKKVFRAPDEVERGALTALDAALAALPADAGGEAIQNALYDVARPIPRYQDLKAKGATAERPGVSIEWFNTLYQVLLGLERGPRFGSFVEIYGITETRDLIRKALEGSLAGAA
mgnify:CR=1 FL=1